MLSRRKASILPGSCNDDETFERTSDNLASFSLWSFQFNNEELQTQYRQFCQSDCNVPLLVLLLLLCLAMFVTRVNWSNPWVLNYTRIFAFILACITTIIGCFAVSLRLAIWKPIASYPLESVMLKQVRTFFQTFHESAFKWTLLNDTLILIFPTCCSLNVLVRSMMPICPPNTSALETASCNPSGSDGIPIDVAMFLIICIISLQVLFKGSRWQAIFFSWCVQVVLVNISIYSAGVLYIATSYWKHH